jgi:hypothetical protein
MSGSFPGGRAIASRKPVVREPGGMLPGWSRGQLQASCRVRKALFRRYGSRTEALAVE